MPQTLLFARLFEVFSKDYYIKTSELTYIWPAESEKKPNVPRIPQRDFVTVYGGCGYVFEDFFSMEKSSKNISAVLGSVRKLC